MAGSLSHRLAKIEQGMGQIGSRCIHCEQYYWRMVSTNRAEGPYSQTARGNEAGLAMADALKKGLVFEEVHEGVVEAFAKVERTRPRNPNCALGCNEWGPWFENVEAGVLLDYPEVAEAFIECLREYAAKPLEERCHYWLCPDVREKQDEYGSATLGGGGR